MYRSFARHQCPLFLFPGGGSQLDPPTNNGGHLFWVCVETARSAGGQIKSNPTQKKTRLACGFDLLPPSYFSASPRETTLLRGGSD